MTLVREGVERLVEAVLVFSRTTSDESNRLDGLPWLEPLPSRAEKYEFRDALGGRFGPDDDLDLDELGEKLPDTNPLLPGAPANAARPFEARFAPLEEFRPKPESRDPCPEEKNPGPRLDPRPTLRWLPENPLRRPPPKPPPPLPCDLPM